MKLEGKTMGFIQLFFGFLKQLVIVFYREIRGDNDEDIYWPDTGGPRFPH